jgi:hypothetical protein
MTDHNTTPADDVERVARAIASSQRLDFDEVCGYETDAEECNSATCVAAHYEDHDPSWAREVFRRQACAAIAAMRPAQGPALPGDIAALLDGTTPGPWGCQAAVTEGDDLGVAIVGANLGGLVGAALPWPTEIDSGDYSRVIANASLFAAAPDLAREVARLRASRDHIASDARSAAEAHKQLRDDLRAELAAKDAEIARLRKMARPEWFYHPEETERCWFSPYEVIDEMYDPEPGEHVFEVTCAASLPSIWCAVTVSDEEDADERFTFTEHATEAEARAALAKGVV